MRRGFVSQTCFFLSPFRFDAVNAKTRSERCDKRRHVFVEILGKPDVAMGVATATGALKKLSHGLQAYAVKEPERKGNTVNQFLVAYRFTSWGYYYDIHKNNYSGRNLTYHRCFKNEANNVLSEVASRSKKFGKCLIISS